MKNYDIATRTIHAGQEPDPSTGAIMTPIYATSTYVQESPGKLTGFDYSRSINPTRLAYEKCVADLESGTRGWAFASGLAAMATVLDGLDSGSHVVASDDLYGGTFRLFEKVRRRSANLDFTFIDMTDASAVEKAMRPNTRMVWVETPSNPLLKLIDLEAVAKIARSLATEPEVERLKYPGLEEHPQHALAKKQMRGVGGMVTIVLKTDLEGTRRFLENTHLFSLAESLGGVESLINHPALMTHGSIPPEMRASLGITDSLVRLSVGVEDVADLI